MSAHLSSAWAALLLAISRCRMAPAAAFISSLLRTVTPSLSASFLIWASVASFSASTTLTYRAKAVASSSDRATTWVPFRLTSPFLAE